MSKQYEITDSGMSKVKELKSNPPNLDKTEELEQFIQDLSFSDKRASRHTKDMIKKLLRAGYIREAK